MVATRIYGGIISAGMSGSDIISETSSFMLMQGMIIGFLLKFDPITIFLI